jgi:hypothetical protein
MDIQLDQEALDRTYSQINYFSNIPKHIKNMVTNFDKFEQEDSKAVKPAHIVNQRMSVIGGKLNMPVFTEVNEFTQHSYEEYSFN